MGFLNVNYFTIFMYKYELLTVIMYFKLSSCQYTFIIIIMIIIKKDIYSSRYSNDINHYI